MYTPMKLTTIYLGDAERDALEELARVSGKTKAECMRTAIREAAKRLTKNRRRTVAA